MSRELAGWGAATLAAAAVVSAAALALARTPAPPVEILLDLGARPPATESPPALALPPMIEEPEPPQVAAPAPPEVTETTPEPPPEPEPVPKAVPAPQMAELAPEAAPEVEAAPPPRPKPKPRPKAERPKPKAKPADAAPLAASAPAQKTAKGGAQSPDQWAKAVLKQIRKVKKAKPPAKGLVRVGFTIGADGGLAGIEVLKSSGDAGLDALALDHIRRAAPFPAPPEGAGTGLAFEFDSR